VNILKVSSDGSAEFTTISEAISKAEPNSRILVSKGIYEESVLIDKPLEIIADDERDKVVIEPFEKPAVKIISDSVLFRGFSVRGHIGNLSRMMLREFLGVSVTNASPIIEDCDIWTDHGFALAVSGELSNPLIRGCKIHGTILGALFESNCRGILEDSEICNAEDYLVRLTHEADPIIKNCRIHNGMGIEVCVNANGLFENCEIFEMELEALNLGDGSTTIRKCKIHDAKRGIVDFYQTSTVEDCEVFRIKKYVPKLDVRPFDFKD
jgi:F-box protein 11